MFDALIRIFALTRKELLAVLKDPRGRFTVLVPPMLQCLVFGYAASYDLNVVAFAVIDKDHSVASSQLLARLDAAPGFQRVASLVRVEDAKSTIDGGRALLVVQIDRDFERQLALGQPANVQVLADGRNSNTAGTALGYVRSIVDAFNADWRATHGQYGPPVHVVTRSWFNPNLESRWQMIPALIGTLTMMQTLLLAALSVAREREEGTFDQLLVTPYRPAEILAGKALPAMVIGTVQATSILLIAQLWFRIPFAGSLLTLYLSLSLFLLAAVGIGLLISAIVGTMQQAMLFSFVLLVPFTMLSGLTTPVSSMPEALQMATLLNPLRYAIAVVPRVYLEGAGLGLLVPNLWPLAVIALVTLSAASWLFRHRLG